MFFTEQFSVYLSDGTGAVIVGYTAEYTYAVSHTIYAYCSATLTARTTLYTNAPPPFAYIGIITLF